MLTQQQITSLKAGMNIPTGNPATQPATSDWVKSLSGTSTTPSLKDIITNRQEANKTATPFQQVGNVAGLASDIAMKGISKIPVVGSVMNFVGKTFGAIVNEVGSKIGDIPAVQKYAMSLTPDEFSQWQKNLQATTDIGNLAMLATGAKEAAPKLGELATKGIDIAKNIPETIAKVGEKVKTGASAITPESGAIMNRVARLTPTDATKFENLSGMSHGDYLAKSGNMGAPDAIIKNEAVKFVNSINTVDTELAKLPGVYESVPLKTMADELVGREQRVSTLGAPSPELARATELKTKLDNGGLNMSEINDLKRIYERNVKLDYQRQNLPEQTAKAVNLDSAVRTWQAQTASDLGFKNIGELNKQTQVSKFIIDKLGKQLVGKTGNDAMGLTDWVILAGHSPESVGAFLTKKFFSSKTVQAKIADLISKEPTIKPVVPDVSITPENINRQVNPKGNLALPEGQKGVPQVQNKVPITSLGKSTMEAPASKINSTDATPLSQPLLEKSPQKSLPKTIPKSTPKVNGLKVKGETPTTNAETSFYHGTSAENATKISSEGFKTGSGKGISGQSSNDFIYATENKTSAGKYVADRLGIKNPTTVKGSFTGKVLDIQGKMADFEAFGEASKKLGVPLGKDSQGKLSMLDMSAIKKAMKEQGYGAIRFSDRYANGSKALAIIPEQIKK